MQRDYYHLVVHQSGNSDQYMRKNAHPQTRKKILHDLESTHSHLDIESAPVMDQTTSWSFRFLLWLMCSDASLLLPGSVLSAHLTLV